MSKRWLMVASGAALLGVWLMGAAFVLALGASADVDYQQGVDHQLQVDHQQLVFVTNTPHPPDLLNQSPQGRVDQYALRTWQEAQLVEVLINQLNRLARGEAEQADAIRYTLFELDQRYPQAPIDFALRERVVNAMLAVPPGSVDMRGMVRPYIVALFNNRIAQGYQPQTNVATTVNGWVIVPQLTHLTPDETLDVILRFDYTVNDVTIYRDALPLVAQGNSYNLPDVSEIPSGIMSVREGIRADFVFARDETGDGIANLLYQQTASGVLAATWQIYGWRDGQIINLAQPGTSITGYDFQTDIAPSGERQVRVLPARLESARWNCVSTTQQTWTYRANFFRPEPTSAPYQNDISIGCRVHSLEPPLFQQPPQAAIVQIRDFIESVINPNEFGYDRAQMALTMLYVLNGQNTDARAWLDVLGDADPDNVYLQGQIGAMQAALDANLSPVQVCAALLAQNAQGACDIDALIQRILTELPVARAGDVRGQLEIAGLPVAQLISVRSLGQAERQYVQFDLTGASWWVFAPTDPAFYVATAGNPPPDYVEPTALPIVAPLGVPGNAERALFVQNDPLLGLTLLEDAAPAGDLNLEARYFRAFALDLQGRRSDARNAYYALWLDAPDSVWGQLAGAHLESRVGN